MMNNQCPSCGTPNRESAKFCYACRTPLSQPLPPASGIGGTGAPLPATLAAGAPTSPAGVIIAASLETVPVSVASPVGATKSNESSPPENPANEPGMAPLVTLPPAALKTNDAGIKVADSTTAPLPPLPAFAVLPEGELLDSRRYEVITVLSSSPKLNAYQVIDHLRRYCGQCGATENGVQDGYCANCGVALPKDQVTYWLRETSEADMWERESQIAERKLWHSGLVNIYRVFQDCPYGNLTRSYLVSDADDGAVLATLPRPQPEENVLAWGQQLAAAVSYLHGQGFRHRSILASNVRLLADEAKLTNFGKAEKVARAEDKDWPANEVADLAKMLHDDLIAGQQLSPDTEAVFAKALSPDKNIRYVSADAFGTDLGNAIEALQRVDSVAFVAGRRSHVGMVREHNEDSLLTLELQRVQLSESQPVGLYVVADGMGGHEAGEVASAVAINTVATVMTDKLLSAWLDGAAPPVYDDLLKDAFQKANQAVYERGRKAHTDMGTTLVGALLIGCEAFVANIGDSRCYRLSRGELKQVTTDHSLVERLIAAGTITREEARVHPQRNYIYRTVGDKPQVDVDVFRLNLKPDDILILCSDGLSGMVDESQMQEAIMNGQEPQAACEKLISLANAAGGDDNISVVVVQVIAANGNR
jgi:serine/threonine protein phosphatase PrpC